MKQKHLHKGLFRFSGVQLLIALTLLMIALPFFEDVAWGEYVGSVLFSFVLLSALLAVGGRRRVMITGLVLITPAVTLRWLSHFTSIRNEAPVSSTGMALAIGFIVWQLLKFVLRAEKVNSEVLCAGISIYILLGLLWASFYLLLQILGPNAFGVTGDMSGKTLLKNFDAVYFSFCTLTTAGYGDVVPLSHHARSLAMLEAVSGVLYMAVLISRLVSLYARGGPASPEKEL